MAETKDFHISDILTVAAIRAHIAEFRQSIPEPRA